MSLKTTPKGLLAALAALCIILLQVPALRGGVANAARANASPATVPARHAAVAVVAHKAAAHSGVRPRALGGSTPISSTGPISFVADFGAGIGPLLLVPGSSAQLSSGQGSQGTAFSVTGAVTSGDFTALATPITLTLTISDASNTRVYSSTVLVAGNGTFAFTPMIPLTAASGPANVVLSARGVTTGDPAEIDTAGAGAGGTPPLTFLVGANANGTFGPSASVSPNSGPPGITTTLTLTNFAPGVTVTPAYVFASGAGMTTTVPLSAVTPISGGANSGSLTAVITIPTTVPYSTTGVISFSAPGVFTPTLAGGFPAFSTVVAPSASISPASGPRCITTTLTLTNFVPGVQVTPTYVYTTGTGAGVTTTVALSAVTPMTGGASAGSLITAITLPNSFPYSTTGAISFSAPYTIPTPAGGFPVFTPVTPTIAAAQFVLGAPTGPSGPLSFGFTTGTSNTVSITGANFQNNSPITLTGSLSSTTSNSVVFSATAPITTGAVTSTTPGAFSGTALFTATVAGTYIITATDLNGCNVAASTITVVSATVPVPSPPVATQYFVEGYTGLGSNNGKASFKTTYDILNPNVSTVLVTNTYLLETTNEDITTTTSAPNVVVVTHTLPALADVRIDAATDISNGVVISGPNAGTHVAGTDQKFATVIQTAGLQGVGQAAGLQVAAGLGGLVRGVAVQRSVERSANTGARYDGDTGLGTTAANTSYYFAEGYTGFQFQEYLLLLNPSPTVTATVSVLRVPEGGATTETPLVDSLVLAPRQRVTLNIRRLNALSPERSIGLIVNSADNPVVAERTEYFGPGNGSAKPGESIAAGLTTAAKQLNFAFGSLTAPITSDVLGTITPSAELAQTADDRPFIEVINPNIAGQLIAGTFSGSATAPGPAAHVTIQLRGENGRLLGFFFTDVDAGARFTLTYNDLTSSSSGIGFPGVPTAAPTRAGVFSAVVSSSERVVAELAQYFGQGGFTPSGDANSGAPGLDLVGAPSGETNVLFPNLNVIDPSSAFPLAHTIFLYNPGVTATRVNGTFFGPAGVVAHQVYTVQPDAIVAIGQASSFSSGTAISPTAPIPAGTTGAEFSTIQQRGPEVSGEPGRAPETFVAAQVTHSADGSQWWGTQGLYPLPTNCATPTGQPLPTGCP